MSAHDLKVPKFGWVERKWVTPVLFISLMIGGVLLSAGPLLNYFNQEKPTAVRLNSTQGNQSASAGALKVTPQPGTDILKVTPQPGTDIAPNAPGPTVASIKKPALQPGQVAEASNPTQPIDSSGIKRRATAPIGPAISQSPNKLDGIGKRIQKPQVVVMGATTPNAERRMPDVPRSPPETVATERQPQTIIAPQTVIGSQQPLPNSNAMLAKTINAMEAKTINAMEEYAKNLAQQGRMQDAVKAYEDAYLAGSGPAAKQLYEIFAKGNGVLQEKAKAQLWRQRAVAKGINIPPPDMR